MVIPSIQHIVVPTVVGFLEENPGAPEDLAGHDLLAGPFLLGGHHDFCQLHRLSLKPCIGKQLQLVRSFGLKPNQHVQFDASGIQCMCFLVFF